MNEQLLKIAGALGELAQQRGVMIAAAESCTGGMASAALTYHAGSSAWFCRGAVCYSNAAKQEMLQVSPAVLEQFGAVSEQTAAAMCEGVGKTSFAITGIAGPGSEGNKPAGMVCFAWKNGDIIKTGTQHFSGTREEVRIAATCHALKIMITILE